MVERASSSRGLTVAVHSFLSQVVVDGTRLVIVGGSRRATILLMLQAIRRHVAIRAPCYLFAPTDFQVANRFRARDTTTDGLGILFHGQQQEAWHMGRPLFRCAQEWCGNLDDDARGSHTSGYEARNEPVISPQVPEVFQAIHTQELQEGLGSSSSAAPIPLPRIERKFDGTNTKLAVSEQTDCSYNTNDKAAFSSNPAAAELSHQESGPSRAASALV